MAYENSANYCAIQKVFGVNFVTSKVVSFQMLYKKDVNRVSRIGPRNRDLFKSICYIATVAEYNKQKKQLSEIANIFPDISQWVTWWDARKYHMFPAFQMFWLLKCHIGQKW